MTKALLLGNNPATMAVGKVMGLFCVEICERAADILVMVDGDSYELEDLKSKFRGCEKIIYVCSMNNNNWDKSHPFSFLSENNNLDTYRIALETFSIAELGKTICDIESKGLDKKQPLEIDPNDLEKMMSQYERSKKIDDLIFAAGHQIKNYFVIAHHAVESFCKEPNKKNYKNICNLITNKDIDNAKNILSKLIIECNQIFEGNYKEINLIKNAINVIEDLIKSSDNAKIGSERLKESIKYFDKFNYRGNLNV